MSGMISRLLLVLMTLGALGCSSALDAATRIANASTVVLVEGQPLVKDGIAADVANGVSPMALEAKWRPIVDVFDELVDVTLAMRDGIKAARAAEKAGQEPSLANLLVLSASASRLMADIVAAFPELAEVLK